MDGDTFEKVRNGHEETIRLQYEQALTPFVGFIRKTFHCEAQRGMDIYPEAFSIFYFNIRSGKLTAPLRSSAQTYINSIGWHLYHRRYLDKYNRERLSLDAVNEHASGNLMVDEAFLQNERAVFVRKMLNQLGDPCQTILTHIYLLEKSYSELAQSINMEEATLRKKKFDCLTRLRKLYASLKIEL